MNLDYFLAGGGSFKSVGKPYNGNLATTTGVLKTITPTSKQKVIITSLMIQGTGSVASHDLTIKSNGVTQGVWSLQTDGGATNSSDNIGINRDGWTNPYYKGALGEEITLENLTGSAYLGTISYRYEIIEEE